MTKSIGFYLFGAVAVGLLALHAADYKDAYTAKDEKDVQQAEARLVRALQGADTATLERILAPDYTMIDPLGKAQSKAERISSYRSGDLKLDSFDINEQKVKIYIGGAIVTGRATIKGKHKDDELAGDFRFIDIFERRKEGWQAVYSQLTLVEPEKKKETDKKPAAKADQSQN